MTKVRPILFSSDMVRAILANRKTQTRRLFKPKHKPSLCPYGSGGDLLWVRETYAPNGDGFIYRADEKWKSDVNWKPSLFMPKAASRLALEITSTRLERLLDITEEDAIAEGIELANDVYGWENYTDDSILTSPIDSYKTLWEKINGGDSWIKNPLVWVVEFRRIHETNTQSNDTRRGRPSCLS